MAVCVGGGGGGGGVKATLHAQLIDAVREHEVLYNSDLKEYNDNVHKMRLWRKIARKCDISCGEEAKKIWKNLRDGFRCSLKTLKLYENKDPPRPLKPWKYVDEMEFLRPYMKDRIFTNLAYYDGDTSTLDSGASFVGSEQETIECQPDIDLLAGDMLMDDDEEDYAQADEEPSPLRKKRRGRKRKNEIMMEIKTEDDGGCTAAPPPQQQQQQPSEDSLKLFFDSMYVAARALPPSLQRIVRIKLFQTVTDAEMAAETLELYPHHALTAQHLGLFYGQQLSSQPSQQQQQNDKT